MEHFFAPCPRGLETVLADELRDLGIAAPAPVPGGVGFSGPRDCVYRVNLWSRIASRVMLRVADGTYRGEEDIYQLARTVKWEDHFAPDLQPWKQNPSCRQDARPARGRLLIAMRPVDAL